MGNGTSILAMLKNKREFSNDHEVSFYLMDDGKIEIFCVYPNFDNSKKYISLEIFCEFSTYSEFLFAFGVYLIQDLDRITPKFLLDQYESKNQNKIVEIYCMIDHLIFGGSLRFRNTDNGLFAMDDNETKYHLVSEMINEPEDFIRYTCKYYLVIFDQSQEKSLIHRN